MTRSNWTARLAWGLLLLLAGAGLAVWALSRWDGGARFFGVAPRRPVAPVAAPVSPEPPAAIGRNSDRIAALESRLANVESETRETAGSFGRADALLIAFAARRAIDRGVPLGYLEGLLVNRFGTRHQYAVARVITAGRMPERLDTLTEDYRELAPLLRGGPPEEGWLSGLRRQIGSLATLRYADKPNPKPRARYDRALAALESGDVSLALSETQRLPAASAAPVQAWTERARRYVATQRALDELESAALVGDERPAPASAGSAGKD
jgi:hypothetical protein